MNKTYSIAELENLTGISRRTIHFYTTERLLPPPSGAGSSAAYTDEHFLRLVLISLMKKSHLRLAGIREALDAMSPADMRRLAQQIGKDAPHWDADAIENWIGSADVVSHSKVGPAEVAGKADISDEEFENASMSQDDGIAVSALRSGDFSFFPEKRKVGEPKQSYLASLKRVPLSPSEPWEHFVLKEGIELHIRSDVARSYGSKLDRMLTRIHKQI